MRCAGIIHQAVYALSRHPTNNTKKIPLHDNEPILVLTHEMFSQRWKALQQNEDENEGKGQTIDAPIPILQNVYAMPDQVQVSETDIYDLVEFIQQQTHDKECLQANIIVGKPNKRFRYNTDGVLVRASPINSASQNKSPPHSPHEVCAHATALCWPDTRANV